MVCQRCNWHLRFYEKEQNGEYWGWEDASSYISGSRYESYIYVYECRVGPLNEAALEKRMGSWNYWRRRIFLQRFDAWYYDGEYSAWRECWQEYERWKIKTPEQFLKVLLACARFAMAQMEKDPDYQPPEKFMEVIAKVRPLIQQAIENRSGALHDNHGRFAPRRFG